MSPPKTLPMLYVYARWPSGSTRASQRSEGSIAPLELLVKVSATDPSGLPNARRKTITCPGVVW
jgi:hypothetical protein